MDFRPTSYENKWISFSTINWLTSKIHGFASKSIESGHCWADPWENPLFEPKTWVSASPPELAKFTAKSNDSKHFWADPWKIWFLGPKS